MNDLGSVLLAHAVAQLSPKAPAEEIGAVVEHLIEKLTLPPNDDPSTAEMARDISAGRRQGQRCRVMGTVSKVSSPHRFFDTRSVPKIRREYIEVSLVDIRGDQVPTLQIVDCDHAETLLEASRSGTPILVEGVNIELPELSPRAQEWGLHGIRQSGYLLIDQVSTSYTHLDAIAATEDERAEAKAWLKRAHRTVRTSLTSILLQNLGIITGSYLDDLLEQVVVQATGTGTIGSTPGTIHMLVIGPPGHGKKLLGETAAIINPTFVEVMPGRTSVPGLTGMARQGGSPGALTRASGGVTNIQDAHAYSENEMKSLAPVLQHVMEDGEVRIGGMTGGQTRTAQTGLLIDANRSTALQGSGPCPPILDQLPLKTRFDFISEIEMDIAASWEIGSKILATGTAGVAVSASWKRRLQVLVATLRDRNPIIDLDSVEDQLTGGYKQLADDFSEFLHNHPLVASSLARRMAVSIKKVTSASARSQDRSTADASDAQFALDAARQKLTFIRNHVVRLSTCPKAEGPEPTSWLRQKSGEFKPSELVEEYEAETGHTVSERTFRRHLQKLGAKQAGKGLYRLELPSQPGAPLLSTVGSSAIAHGAVEIMNETLGRADLPESPISLNNDDQSGGRSDD